jgi:hypothetical protein
VSAEADPGRVRLTWREVGGSAQAATVCRRTEAEPWGALGEAGVDGTDLIVYDDRTVVPGGRYGYRLAVLQDGSTGYAGETWVDVPAVAQLALTGVRPNPAVKELTVAFTLPDAAPARLEAFDLAGRRVATRDVGALGGGSHVVTLGTEPALASGIYLVRLTRGGRTLTTRAVLIR